MVDITLSITRPDLIAGMTAARERYNQDNAHNDGFVELISNDDYVQFVFTNAAISWAKQFGTYDEDAPDPEPVPFPALAPWRFRAMLEIAGLTETVENAITAIEDDTIRAVAQAKLEYTLEFHRDDPLIAMLAATIGLTTEQIDEMWTQASEL